MSGEDCRCDACREANRVYGARRRAVRYAWVREHGLPGGVEHGASAYQNWGCRCDTCRASVVASVRKWRAGR